ncbi:hypothetical protein BD779DRAFT_1491048 [Infundibulicybe gibba]|nr:hypothetical protein BD779DRAFT_1491048 [Infundibulicybe gibba]
MVAQLHSNSHLSSRWTRRCFKRWRLLCLGSHLWHWSIVNYSFLTASHGPGV